MTVWTIAAQEGTPGDRVAAQLAASADVPLYNRTGLAELAHRSQIEIPELDHIEERFCRRNTFLLSIAVGAVAFDAASELKIFAALPDLGRLILTAAAHTSCVIYAAAASAVLSEHPASVHVRLRAPFEWRVAAYQHEHLVDRHHSEKALKHSDHLQRAWVQTLYHLDLDDDSRYSIVVDASRLSCDRLVEILLAAGGATNGLAATT